MSPRTRIAGVYSRRFLKGEAIIYCFAMMSGCVQMLWGERRGHGTFGAVEQLPSSPPPVLVPGIERHPLKKLDAREEGVIKLLHHWRDEAGQAGREIKRIVVAYEAGRDDFWLARWLRARDIEA